jgi:hypothetical protein
MAYFTFCGSSSTLQPIRRSLTGLLVVDVEALVVGDAVVVVAVVAVVVVVVAVDVVVVVVVGVVAVVSAAVCAGWAWVNGHSDAMHNAATASAANMKETERKSRRLLTHSTPNFTCYSCRTVMATWMNVISEEITLQMDTEINKHCCHCLVLLLLSGSSENLQS